ncbi:MAG TPA: TIGR04013 family B12-binding domain/radical SAM domain-containing protein [bacterium]|nr:TIGR04013 family B12-binding domain/radical SAM domain-containing protein [bacterium]
MTDTPLVFRLTGHNRTAMRSLIASLEAAGVPPSMIRTVRELHELDDLPADTAAVFLFSAMTADLDRSVAEMRHLRDRFPNARFIIGGPHASARPREVIERGFDHAAVGEGEEMIRGIAERVREGVSLDGVRGLFRIEGNELVGDKASPVDIERFPMMAHRAKLYGPIEITRGCASVCRYCQTSFFHGVAERWRSREAILAAVRELAAREFAYYRFLSPNALGWHNPDGRTPEPLHELLAAVRDAVGPRRKVIFGTFPAEIRPEFATRESMAVIKRYCDNPIIVVGGQSGSDRMLEHMHRGHTVADIYRAVENTKAAGLHPIVDLIFGLPGETPDDLALTVALMERLLVQGAHIRGHIFMPLPGTPWEHERPGEVPDELARRFKWMSSRGMLSGCWEEQSALNRRADN